MRGNFDVIKARIQRRFRKKYGRSNVLRMGAAVNCSKDLDQLRLQVKAEDAHRRQARVLDYSTLNAGAALLVCSAALLGLAAATLYVLSVRPNLPGWLSYFAAMLGVLGGWSLLAGWSLRHAPNLPFVVTADDVVASQALLDACDERHRALAGPLQRHLATLMLTAEAFLLLIIVMPLLADSLSPNAQLVAAIPLAIFVGAVQLKLISRIGRSLAVLRVRQKYSRLSEMVQSEQAQKKVQALIQHYGDTVVQKWTKPTLIDYIAASLWCCLALIAIVAICWARVTAGEIGSISVVATIIMGGLAFVFVVLAVAAEATSTVMLPELAIARRIIDRFHSRHAYDIELDAENRGGDAEVVEIFRWLKEGYERAHTSSLPGGRSPEPLDFSVNPQPQGVSINIAASNESVRSLASRSGLFSKGGGYA